MQINGITYCDFCATVIHPNDGTHITIPHKGELKGFDYHNTREIPCLSKELDLLHAHFTASQAN
jgi:hypothetical protein